MISILSDFFLSVPLLWLVGWILTTAVIYLGVRVHKLEADASAKYYPSFRDKFKPPFKAKGLKVLDDNNYVVARIDPCLLSEEEGEDLAEQVVETLNGNGSRRKLM